MKYPLWNKVYFSRETGNEEAFKEVVDRFYRLNNGLWIRTIPGRNKGKYKLTKEQQERMKQHIVCSREECQMLDKFVTDDYRRPHYFPDDPYEPYHRKSNIVGHKYTPRKFYP